MGDHGNRPAARREERHDDERRRPAQRLDLRRRGEAAGVVAPDEQLRREEDDERQRQDDAAGEPARAIGSAQRPPQRLAAGQQEIKRLLLAHRRRQTTDGAEVEEARERRVAARAIPTLDEHGHESEGETVLIERLRRGVPGQRRGPDRRRRAEPRRRAPRVSGDENVGLAPADQHRAQGAEPGDPGDERARSIAARHHVQQRSQPLQPERDQIERGPHHHRPERTAIGHVMSRSTRAEELREAGQHVVHVERVKLEDGAQIVEAEPAVARRLALEHAAIDDVIEAEQRHGDGDEAIAAGEPRERATETS